MLLYFSVSDLGDGVTALSTCLALYEIDRDGMFADEEVGYMENVDGTWSIWMNHYPGDDKMGFDEGEVEAVLRPLEVELQDGGLAYELALTGDLAALDEGEVRRRLESEGCLRVGEITFLDRGPFEGAPTRMEAQHCAFRVRQEASTSATA